MAGKQAKGVGGGHGRENVPLPLPTPQTHQEVFFTCRMRTGPNGARGWERARAWNHPSRPNRPPPTHISHLGAVARPRAGSVLSGQHLPPAPADRLIYRTLAQHLPAQAWWELSVQDHKPSSAPTREGQSLPQTFMSLSLPPPNPSLSSPLP